MIVLKWSAAMGCRAYYRFTAALWYCSVYLLPSSGDHSTHSFTSLPMPNEQLDFTYGYAFKYL